MAEAERILAALGAVPKGAAPKTILAGDENQEPGYYQTDPLSNLVRTLKKRQLEIDDALKKKQEATQKKTDMYKTLREAGYDPKSAYEAVIKGEFPLEAGGESLKEQQGKAGLEKTVAQTEYYKSKVPLGIKEAEEKIKLIDAQIAKIDKETTSIDNPLEKEKKQKQIDKLNAQIELINSRVGQQDQGNILDEALGTDNIKQEEMIPVFDPQGKPFKIPKSRLAEALKAGWKKR
jgi:tRNA splicing endonuclease